MTSQTAATEGQEPAAFSDPRHSRSSPKAIWSTANVAEAMPGVLTPLGWTLWGRAAERAVRRTFFGFGVLGPDETDVPPQEEDRVFGIFFGRVAARTDFMCLMGDRLPGTSGTEVAEHIFASLPDGFESHPTRRYYPTVAARLPVTMLRAPRLARTARASTEEHWQPELARIAAAGADETRARFRAAVERFHHNLYCQSMAVFAVVQPIYDQLTQVMAAVDGAEAELMGGYGEHEESQMVTDLWACSRGRMDADTFVTRHGYHGPREGEISAFVWREDPSPLERILEGYRALSDDADPVKAQAERVRKRQRAEADLLGALRGPQQIWARTVLSLARRYVPLRAVGKVAFLQSIDLARAAARRLGTCLAGDGVLADPSDVFFLTVEEICAGNWVGVHELVVFRRERHREYEGLELPGHWQGTPQAERLRAAEVDESLVLEGLGVSSGIAEGRVRVVSDPGETVMQPGEILVAHTTDPGWACILLLSSALVIDIGGVLSHAPVMARELGVPCVVNTKVGTKVLRTGDLCRVDGSTGRIQVLERVGQ